MRRERRPGCRDRRSQSTETWSKENTSAMRGEWYLRRKGDTEMSAKSQGQTRRGSGLDGKGDTREGTGFRDRKAFANGGEAKSRHAPRFRPDESYGITKPMETGRGDEPPEDEKQPDCGSLGFGVSVGFFLFCCCSLFVPFQISTKHFY